MKKNKLTCDNYGCVNSVYMYAEDIYYESCRCEKCKHNKEISERSNDLFDFYNNGREFTKEEARLHEESIDEMFKSTGKNIFELGE